MIEEERVMDKIGSFSMEDLFDADKRKSHERLLETLCKLWVSIGKKNMGRDWSDRVERFGQFIDAGIERYDHYHQVIIKELEDESN